MTLSRKIIDLGRPDLLHQPDQIGRVSHVSVMKQERHVAGVPVFVEMIYACCVKRGGPTLDAMNDVTKAEQVFCKISAVLTGNTRNESNAPFCFPDRHVNSSKYNLSA